MILAKDSESCQRRDAEIPAIVGMALTAALAVKETIR
jgi:hypothetical protein